MNGHGGGLLVVSPHPDDDILGAGGTMSKAVARGWEVTVLTVTTHGPPLYEASNQALRLAETRDAHALLGISHSLFLDHPTVEVDRIPNHVLNRQLEDTVAQRAPRMVLVPFPGRHVDHRRIFDAAMVATRPVGVGRGIQLIAAYEIISDTHWNAPGIEAAFNPTLFVDISDHVNAKVTAMACHASQVHPPPGPRSLNALRAQAAFRGNQVGVAGAEAFQVIRAVTSCGL